MGYNPEGEYYIYFNGTSAATPYVAGMAGLILSKWPSLMPSEVQAIIEATADRVGGYTYVNGRCNDLGHGRINAGCALTAGAPLFLGGNISGTQSHARTVVRLTNASVASGASISIEAAEVLIQGNTTIPANAQLTITPRGDFICD